MNATYVYPGSFCPPTYGHLAVLAKAAQVLGEVVVVCSRDEKKQDYWFSPEECAELWQSYDLPDNVKITTISKFLDEKVPGQEIVMIRGIRGESDLEHEAEVMEHNRKFYGINKYLYFLADEVTRSISSTAARKAAEELDFVALASLVSPVVAGRLLEKVLGVDNLIMVVGQPGSGKSTFLSMLCEEDSDYAHINTDLFNRQLRPILATAFPGRDLVEMALNEPEILRRTISKPWFMLLAESLKTTTEAKHILVEVAYGLEPGMDLYRYLGGKILAFGCSRERLLQRNDSRGTPMYVPFIDKIPDLNESKKIAEKKKLNLLCFENNGADEEKLKEFVTTLKEHLGGG